MRDYKLYLYDLKEAIDKVESFTEGLTSEEFAKDVKTIDAVTRNLQVIGEAAGHIPKRIKEEHRNIDWRGMVGMRNILVHEYFGVRLEIIWKTIRERLPELREQVEEILKEE